VIYVLSKYTVTVHGLFKYMMRILHTRVNQEWKDLDVTYPLWMTRVVMDDAYYILALVLVCVTCFAVGLVIGIVWTVV
jgi:hypothetical protein